jgi:hypothetical protein
MSSGGRCPFNGLSPNAKFVFFPLDLNIGISDRDEECARRA